MKKSEDEMPVDILEQIIFGDCREQFQYVADKHGVKITIGLSLTPKEFWNRFDHSVARYGPLLESWYGRQCVYCGWYFWTFDTKPPLLSAWKCKTGYAIRIPEIDHIIPKCQEGTDCLDNLAISCRNCNLKKRGRTPSQAGMILHFWPDPDAIFREYYTGIENNLSTAREQNNAE